VHSTLGDVLAVDVTDVQVIDVISRYDGFVPAAGPWVCRWGLGLTVRD